MDYNTTLIRIKKEHKEEFHKIKGQLQIDRKCNVTDSETVYELIQRYNQNRK